MTPWFFFFLSWDILIYWRHLQVPLICASLFGIIFNSRKKCWIRHFAGFKQRVWPCTLQKSSCYFYQWQPYVYMPPPCLTNDVIWSGSEVAPFLLHFSVPVILVKLWFPLSRSFFLFRCFLMKSNLTFLFLSLTSDLHLVENTFHFFP